MFRRTLMLLVVFSVVFALFPPGFAGFIKGDIAKGLIVSIDTV